MESSFAATSLTKEEFQQAADAMAAEFFAVLQGRTLRATVVMEALMQVYRFSADHLTPDAKAATYMGMAAFAAEQAHAAAHQAPMTTH
ncbi:hypothetical protein [Comamonas terrigena]|uniref:hypothetical protein n=1 Tax=Comamonas terrigena TaxID=32013 RepID=UPI002448D9C1|nr:hypothetical protein [Comamonas terrigena]MDH0048603.1 hypothetical protein [Comamonas terrigena]MDH0511583.1 hypothetical protein [Comamonas terrigena]MDH1090959.1 hypothetical protein [Comamonas terrigena]